MALQRAKLNPQLLYRTWRPRTHTKLFTHTHTHTTYTSSIHQSVCLCSQVGTFLHSLDSLWRASCSRNHKGRFGATLSGESSTRYDLCTRHPQPNSSSGHAQTRVAANIVIERVFPPKKISSTENACIRSRTLCPDPRVRVLTDMTV